MSGTKIVEGLKQTVADNLSRITIDGQVWERTSSDPNPAPPFYCTKTLLGFGGADLNGITLQMPGRYHESNRTVLCEINAPRTDDDIKRWNALARDLSRVWLKYFTQKRPDRAENKLP